MTSHELSANLKNTAREKLVGRYGSSILIVVLASLIEVLGQMIIVFPVAMVTSFISILTGTQEIGIGYYITIDLLTTILSIFTNILNTGLALFFLNIACGRQASCSDLWYGYRYLFKKSFAISAIQVAIQTVITLPYTICDLMYVYDSTGTSNWRYYTVITYVVCSIASLFVFLCFSQVYYLLLDFPGYSVKQLFTLSIRIMKGRKLKYLFMDLSFIPLELLSILSYGIGMLWVTPYRLQTRALFFLDTMKASDSSQA